YIYIEENITRQDALCWDLLIVVIHSVRQDSSAYSIWPTYMCNSQKLLSLSVPWCTTAAGAAAAATIAPDTVCQCARVLLRANFAPEPLFNIPPPTAAIPPAPLPSAAEINSLYTPTSHQHRRQVIHPRRSTGHYRPSSASSYASASVQNALPRSNNRNQLQSQQRGYSSRKEKNSPPAPPSTASPKFSESDNNKGSHTLHAVIDYDDYDEVLTSDVNGNGVTPIQGPILLKNGTVPVVPLYSYPVAKNGSFVQIPPRPAVARLVSEGTEASYTGKWVGLGFGRYMFPLIATK
ncbi:hypothetical protein B566_EDAN008107, partial [Ephemera danica]